MQNEKQSKMEAFQETMTKLSRYSKIVVFLTWLIIMWFELAIYNMVKTISSPFVGAESSGFIKGIFMLIREDFLLAIPLLLFPVFAAYLMARLLGQKRTSDPRGFKLNKKGTQGNAQMMPEAEKRKLFELREYYHPTGIILGKDKETGEVICQPWKNKDWRYEPANGNILVCGASGKAKTTGVLLPMIYSCMEAGTSLFVTDSKGEIYSKTYPAAKALGYKVVVFDIMGKQFEYSDGFDVLKVLRESEEPLSDADLIVTLIVNNIGSQKDDFWNDQNKTMLKLCLLTVARAKNYQVRFTRNSRGEAARTLEEAYSLIASSDAKNIIKKVIDGNVQDKELLSQMYDTCFQHEKSENIRAGLASKLEIFQNKSLMRVLSEDEIDFNDVNNQKTIIYLLSSDKDRTYKTIMALFTSLFFKLVTDIADDSPGARLKRPLYMVFEEFNNVGYVPDLSQKISTLRSRDMKMVFCYQSIAQIMDTYSNIIEGRHEYITILANCAVQLCCGAGKDELTEKYFSDMTGMMTIDEMQRSKDIIAFLPSSMQFDPHQGERSTPRGRPVLLPDEIRRIHKDEILICNTEFNATLEDKYFYKDHPVYQYQAVDEMGNVYEPRHTDRIPTWKKTKIMLENQLLTGVKKYPEDPVIEVKFIKNYHKSSLYAEDDDEDELNHSVTGKIMDFFFKEEEVSEKGKRYSLEDFKVLSDDSPSIVEQKEPPKEEQSKESTSEDDNFEIAFEKFKSNLEEPQETEKIQLVEEIHSTIEKDENPFGDTLL